MKKRVGALLMALVLVLSSFVSYAEDDSWSDPYAAEQAAAEEAARIAAEQQAAAEQAAAEEAARIAAEQQAAAEQAAAEEAARQAAEQQAAEQQAAAEQAAAEEAARIAAEQQAAAEQAAAEAAAQQAEEQAAADAGNAEEQIQIFSAEEGTQDASETAERVFQASIDGIAVTVTVPGTALPKNAELQVTHFGKDSGEYQAALHALNLDTEETENTTNLEALDLYFTTDGAVIDPSDVVSVKINLSSFLAGDADRDPGTIEAWHFVTATDGTYVAGLVADAGNKSTGSVNTGTAELEFQTSELRNFGLTWEDVKAETEPGTEIETESESETEPGTEAESETESEMESGTEAESETEIETETETEGESETDTEEEEKVYTAKDGGVFVTVTAAADAFPEDAELSVKLYSENSAEYEEAADVIGYEEIAEENGVATLDAGADALQVNTGLAVVDIAFYADGEEVEPSEPVNVVIDASGLIPEEADTGSIEVQHLKDTDAGVEPVVVANAEEGNIDEANATAEFEIESFSTFTVTWSWMAAGTTERSISVDVTAYLDGVDISDDIEDVTFDSENDELDLETLLSDVGYGTGDYTFDYAIAYAGDTEYGSRDNPVVSIQISQGTSSSVDIICLDGTTYTTSNSVTIESWYTTPEFTVEISAAQTDEAEDWLLQASISHTAEYDYDHIEYEWSITNLDGSETDAAVIDWTDATGRAFIKWVGEVEDGTEVLVKVKANLCDADGTVIASSSNTAEYILEYGKEDIVIEVTYGTDYTFVEDGTEVTLTNTATGESTTYTTKDGKISANIEPGIYTVVASYTDEEGNKYFYSGTISLHDEEETYSINLKRSDASTEAVESNSNGWEHIDIKLAVGTSSDSSSTDTVKLTVNSVTISENGDSVTTDHVEGNDNEFQCFWPSSSEGGTHSTSFTSDATITIVYTMTWVNEEGETVDEQTYTIVVDRDTVYDRGTTYPVTGQRAYKLYNYLYGTEYSSDAQMVADGIGDIDISGMSMMLVAAILCDSSVVTGAGGLDVSSRQCGLDFAFSIEAVSNLSTNWAFDLEKTYLNHEMSAGMFQFILNNAIVDTGSGNWIILTEEDELTNSRVGKDIYGNSSDTMENVSIPYSDDEIEEGKIFYYILLETQGNAEYTTYDNTVFGVKVELSAEGFAELGGSKHSGHLLHADFK